VIEASAIVAQLRLHGVTLASGVPCSYLAPLLDQVSGTQGIRYLAATQEGEAAAIAAGAWLGGGLGCVLSQNSGLGNMVNPLTSLLHPASIPALLLVTWRGEPGGADEPQHQLMGQMTAPLLDLMRIPWEVLPGDPGRLAAVMARAFQGMAREGLARAIVVRKGTIAAGPPDERATSAMTASPVTRSARDRERPARATVLSALLGAAPPGALIITTTGYTSRELYAIDDRPSNFYLVGAMGSAAPVGLGVATQTSRPVIVVDGDGALLMRLGSLATVGAYGRSGFLHIVLDNGQHESTGGQRTVSPWTDLAGAAAACGYRQAYACATVAEFADALPWAFHGPGPAFIHLPIRPGTFPGLGRPVIAPAQVALRFRETAAAPARC
jgi:phosphonopyruvate decarboxylase